MPEIPAFSPETVSTAAGVRLDLRPLAVSDTQAWIAHVRADLEHLGQHLGWPSRTIDPHTARRFIARYDAREGGRMLLLGAFARQSLTGGAVLMSYEPSTGSIEMGCWLIAELEGQGVAGAMCQAALAFARNKSQVHRVESGSHQLGEGRLNAVRHRRRPWRLQDRSRGPRWSRKRTTWRAAAAPAGRETRP